MKIWDVVKAVAGAYIIVYGTQFCWEFAKARGRREVLEEMQRTPQIRRGVNGEPVAIEIDGRVFNLKIEEI